MGPEDQHPWDAQDEEIRQAFAAKDAEIESFKEDRNRFTVILREKDAEIERLKELAKYDAFLREKYRGLITELCDALDRSDPIQISIQEVADLIQRAQEAT